MPIKKQIFGQSNGVVNHTEHWIDCYKETALTPVPGKDSGLFDNLPRIQAELVISNQFLTRYQISPKSWLNIACGPAPHHIIYLLQRYPNLNLTGIDYSPIYVEQARIALNHHRVTHKPAWTGQIEIQEGDMRALTFTTNAFEVISIYGNSFGCFDDETHLDILGQLYGLLRSPGLLLITIPDYRYAVSHTVENPMLWEDDFDSLEGAIHTTGYRAYDTTLGRSINETIYTNPDTQAQITVYASLRVYPIHSQNGLDWSWQRMGTRAGFSQVLSNALPHDGRSPGIMAKMEMVGLVKG